MGRSTLVNPNYQKQVYVLMTDGDIIFKAPSVRLLLETISHNPSLGGVCARLKPQGDCVGATVGICYSALATEIR